MEITEQDLKTFIILYQDAYGVTFSAEKAEKELSKLLQLYKLLYLTPIASAKISNHGFPKSEYNKLVPSSHST